MTTAEKLKTRRLKLGLTQAQVAVRADMSTVQYNGYERARHEPSSGTLSRLAGALNTTIRSLSGDGEDPEASYTADGLKEALRRLVAKDANWPFERVRVVIHLE